MASQLRPSPLVWVALASAALNVVCFLRPFPLAEWWNYARLDYAWLTQYDLRGQLGFLGAFGALFLLYHYAVVRLRARPTEGPLWLILSGQVLVGLPLVGIYPVAALDVFDYLLYGRLGAYWGANPLAQPPSRYPAEPLLAYSYWPNEPSVYGPLWQLVSQWVTLAVEGQLLAGLLAFKLLALAAALATTALIWWTLLALRPGLAPAGALLYGWNPLQQFESAGNGHNDALMVLFLALSLALLVRGPRPLSLPSFAAGLLVKITLAPLAPLIGLAPLLLGPRRGGLSDLAIGAALAAALVVLLYAPFWEGRASLPFLDRGNWFTASPPTLLRELLRREYEFEAAGRIAATLCAGAFAIFSAVVLGRLVLRARRQMLDGTLDAIIRAGYGLFFGYLVIACLWWQPWYLLVLLVFAALSGDRRLADRANLFCLGGLLSYPVFKYVWAIHQADWQLDYLEIMAISVVAIFSLPLAHLAAEVACQVWRSSPVRRQAVEPALSHPERSEGSGGRCTLNPQGIPASSSMAASRARTA
jgi:hypothetical protein